VSSKKHIEQNFEVDRLTDSIVNTISGDSFQTEISVLTSHDLKTINQKAGWNFDWQTEYDDLSKEVYKLSIINNPTIIQGLISVSIESDHVYMNLLESAPFNVGQNKLYEGVSGNLVAFACKLSFQKGFSGFVAFHSKTNLIEHYEKTLGATHFKNLKMIIETDAASFLMRKYFKI
jgi:hypothetical protein